MTGRVAISPHPIAEVGASIHSGTYDGDAMLTLVGVDAMVRRSGSGTSGPGSHDSISAPSPSSPVWG